MEISTEIFRLKEFRLPYGISNNCEYHIWEVGHIDGSFQEYIHSPKRMKVIEILNNTFSLIQYLDSDDPEMKCLFDGRGYVTEVEMFDKIKNNTK